MCQTISCKYRCKRCLVTSTSAGRSRVESARKGLRQILIALSYICVAPRGCGLRYDLYLPNIVSWTQGNPPKGLYPGWACNNRSHVEYILWQHPFEDRVLKNGVRRKSPHTGYKWRLGIRWYWDSCISLFPSGIKVLCFKLIVRGESENVRKCHQPKTWIQDLLILVGRLRET